MNSYFSIFEIFTIFTLSSILILSTRLVTSRNKLSIINPLFIYSIIIFYYTLASPIYQVLFGTLLSRGIDFRDLLIYGWWGALISTLFVFIGYSLTGKNISFKRNRICRVKNKTLVSIAIVINTIGYLGNQWRYGITFSSFNPFFFSESNISFLKYQGAFKGYLSYTLDFLIAGNILLLIVMLNTRKIKFLFLINFILTTGLYLTGGFRYRLFFLLFSTLFYYLLFERKKNIFIYTYSFIGLLSISFLNSFIEIVRKYGYGFQLENLSNYSLFGIFKNILDLAETTVFLTTCGIIKIVPTFQPYVYFYPFYKILIHPFPSSFFNKDPGDYIKDALIELYGSQGMVGAAMHNFGEYYLMGGWIGIILMSLILGYIFKKIWIWGNLHKEEPLGLAVYTMNISFIFMIISRGYLPQQFQLYAFSILPINLIYFLNSTPIKNKNLISK